MNRLWPLLLLLSACTRASIQPDGGWEFFPSELVFNTQVGQTDAQRFSIKNTSQSALEVAIERPVPDGDCPESPFQDVAESTRIGANSEVELSVVHAPLTATPCNFLLVLYNADDDQTGQRALRLSGGVRDVDSDDDGWGRGEGDCDDNNPDIFPTADERCDGIDNDCDGLVDNEDDSVVDQIPFLPDTDGDTFPAQVAPRMSCTQPVGFVPVPDPTVPALQAYDCNDQVFGISPAAYEQVGTGIDQNCDGFISCYADADLDRFGSPRTIVDHRTDDPFCLDPGVTLTSTDCDDADPAINPNALERCDGGAGIDEDCDNLVNDADPSVTEQVVWYLDGDEDTQGQTSITLRRCAASDPSVPGTQYVRNGKDCNDANPAIFEGADEVCNGIDDDCDGVPDNDPINPRSWYIDADADGFGEAGTANILQGCAQPLGYAPNPSDCDDANSTINPGAPEGPGDGIDQNCDAREVCYLNADGDGYGGPASQLSTDLTCTAANLLSNVSGDCDDTDPASFPGAPEVCDGADNDCDSRIDDADEDLITNLTWYRDADGDLTGDPGFPVRACTQPVGFVPAPDPATPLPNGGYDCNDRDSGTRPTLANANEAIANGIDESCDGTGLCYVDLDGDGDGDDSGVTVTSTSISCALPGVSATRADCDDSTAAVGPHVPERCDPGSLIDEDCDGLTDDEDGSVIGGDLWFRDGDHDGFGNAAISLVQCAAPSGFVANDTDCDDRRADVNPAATEVCDGLDRDEDCDGLADDHDPSTDVAGTGTDFWPDLDADGFGDALAASPGWPARACDAGAAEVANAADCNDATPAERPGATEQATDGIDQNCDGQELCYEDLDGDGVGNERRLTASPDLDCLAPGVAPVGGDCDDLDGSIGADERFWFFDADDDGFGNANIFLFACAPPNPDDWVDNSDDCADGDASRHPAATEICDPLNLDEDCDGLADDIDSDLDPLTDPGARPWYDDADGDGFGDAFDPGTLRCDPLFGEVGNAGDCLDVNSAVRPGAAEVAGDTVDQNCDGQELCYVNADGDSFGSSSAPPVLSADLACSVASGLSTNNFDCNDADASAGADQAAYFLDSDLDGHGNPNVFLIACLPPPTGTWVSQPDDCDDANPNISPDALERCDPINRDEDCDGLADDLDPERAPSDFDTTTLQAWYDDADSDGFGDALGLPRLACDAGFAEVANALDCDDLDDSVRPGATERPGDGVDQNCDGQERCWVDGDADGYGSAATAPVPSPTTCVGPGIAPTGGDCADNDGTVSPGAPEVCNGTDDDCDNRIDDADDSRVTTPTDIHWRDADGDGFGNPASFVYACQAPGGYVGNLADCDDADAAVKPGATERPADFRDQDCDRFEVCYVDADTDGFGGSALTADDQVLGCTTSGVADNDHDCDDTNPAVQDDGTVWHVDADGDTYGSDLVTVVSCARPGSAWVARGGDCADGDPQRNPGATEVCDGVDDNCNGTPDDGVTTDWHYDGDGDGFGLDDVITAACTRPPLHVASGGDCDDDNDSVYPGALDWCDTLVNDCDRVGLALPDEDDLDCPGTWTALSGQPYLFLDLNRTLPQAEAICASVGYHLAWIDSAAEEADLLSVAQPTFGSNDAFWLGARRFGPCFDSAWQWYDPNSGRCLDVSPYALSRLPAEADDGVRLDMGPGAVQWRNEPDSDGNKVVCELP